MEPHGPSVPQSSISVWSLDHRGRNRSRVVQERPIRMKVCFGLGEPYSPLSGSSGYVNTSRVLTGKGQRGAGGPALGIPERSCDPRPHHRVAHPLCFSRDLSSNPTLIMIVHKFPLKHLLQTLAQKGTSRKLTTIITATELKPQEKPNSRRSCASEAKPI